jgi:hypothetical protein
MNDAYAHAMQLQKCNLTPWVLQASPRHINVTGQEVTSPAATGCWCLPRVRAFARMQEHVILVVKILDDRTLCDPVKYKISE